MSQDRPNRTNLVNWRSANGVSAPAVRFVKAVDRDNSRGVISTKINGEINDINDLISNYNKFPTTFGGLPIYDVSTTALPGQDGIAWARYRTDPNSSSNNSRSGFLKTQITEGLQSVPVWNTINSETAINIDHRGMNPRIVEAVTKTIIWGSVNFQDNAPSTALASSGLEGTVNENVFVIPGVRIYFPSESLFFVGTRMEHQKLNSGGTDTGPDRWVHYHVVKYRQVPWYTSNFFHWEESYRGDGNIARTRLPYTKKKWPQLV